MCIFKSNKKDKTSVVVSRKYRCLSTNFIAIIKSHKELETELFIDLTHEKGTLEFHLFNPSNEEVLSLVNAESNTYSYKLKPNHGYTLKIKSKSAVGAYKVYKVIYRNTNDNHSN